MPDLLLRLAEISQHGNLNDVPAVSKILDTDFDTETLGPSTTRHFPGRAPARRWQITWYVTTKPEFAAENKDRAVMQIEVEPQYCVRVQDMERVFGAKHNDGYVIRDFSSPEARDKWEKEAVSNVDIAEYSLPGKLRFSVAFSFGRRECLSNVVLGQELP